MKDESETGLFRPSSTILSNDFPPRSTGEKDSNRMRLREESSQAFHVREKRGMKSDAGAASGNGDLDVLETREWLDSLDSVLQSSGTDRAGYLLTQLKNKALRHGVSLGFTANTPYINTI